jgi:hypothetical protein
MRQQHWRPVAGSDGRIELGNPFIALRGGEIAIRDF